MQRMPTVAIGSVGPTKDGQSGPDRWNVWRPSVALAQQPDLELDRYELIYQQRFQKLAKRVADDVRSISPHTEVRLHRIALRDPWDFAEVYGVLHDFARDYPFDPDAEDYLVHITTGSHAWQVCLFLLTESRRLPAKLVQTAPPQRGDVPGAPGTHTIIDLDLSRYDRLAERFAAERREGVSFLKDGIETRNGAFNALIDRIEHVALHSDAPILLTGATGVGKTRLARRIYELKHRHHKAPGAFIEVNCATLRGDAAMSALFGHEKGAFTGAVAARAGLLRAADAGVLFLDEIAELGLDEQAMLLRAIEERAFLPVGADIPVTSDFRLIAGTNVDLRARVSAGRFRDDLLARIDLWSFRLPTLAERREDIEPNLAFELERHVRDAGRAVTFQRRARERFLAFASAAGTPWTANFRDLSAAVTRMATLAGGGRITDAHVAEEIERLCSAWHTGGGAAFPLAAEALGSERAAELDRFDLVQLEEVLRVARASRTQSEAGRTLFAASGARRRTRNDADRLAKYLARFDLRWGDVDGRGAGPARAASP
jgi:transcriptional regulatory protein RtcR